MRIAVERAAKTVHNLKWFKVTEIRGYISGIERGNRNVGIRNIAAIADALNISISELMKDI